MPRPMFMQKEQTQQKTELSLNNQTKQAAKVNTMSKMQMDRLLRKTRTKKYMEQMKQLDIGGHVHNQQLVQQMIDAITEEFPEVQLAGILIGIVSKCYLGDPYEVHSLSVTGGIIEHYQRGSALPGEMEKARSLAMNNHYEFIEVYSDCLRAVSSNGSVSVINI